jgi:hypothetical protein
MAAAVLRTAVAPLAVVDTMSQQQHRDAERAAVAEAQRRALCGAVAEREAGWRLEEEATSSLSSGRKTKHELCKTKHELQRTVKWG